ncbi:MAG TPA: hypothetical protein VL947_04045 [Cytophagales bacterium]|nr:hypothetical protein [Cytophagales bacterium]
MFQKFENIDLKLEKLVFLLNAEEGNTGIHELTLELTKYNLVIEDTYKVARVILNEIIREDLVVLERYSDSSLHNYLTGIRYDELPALLNNPMCWYPCNEILAIRITEKGAKYLDEAMPQYAEKLKRRLYGNA